MNEKKEQILNDKISSLLIRFSIPAIIAMLVNAIYNLVDSIFVSQSEGVIGANAVGLVYPIFMLIPAFGLGIGQGAASVISRAIGSGDDAKAKHTVQTSYFLTFVIGIVLALVGLFFVEDILSLFNPSSEVMSEAVGYAQVVMLFSFFTMFAMTGNNILRSMGLFIYAMIAMILGMLINIILDPIFIFDNLYVFGINIGLGLGTKGAAIATAIGYISTFVFYIYLSIVKVPFMQFRLKYFKVDFNNIKEISLIGLPSFIRNGAAALIIFLVNYLLVIYADKDLHPAVYGATSRLIMFLFMPSFGIIQGLAPIIGTNYGAKDYKRTNEAINLGIKVEVIYFAIAYLVILLFGEMFYGWFLSSDDPNRDLFIQEGYQAILIMMLPVVFLSIQVVASSTFQAVGKAMQANIVSLSRQLFILPIIFFFAKTYGDVGIWISFAVADTLASGFSLIMLIFEKRELSY